MIGIRATELAKELEMTVAELLNQLTELGVQVEGPATVVDAETAQAVREMFPSKNGGAKTIELPAVATVKELATAMGMQASDVQKKLMSMGVLAAVNQRLSPDAAKKLAAVFGFKVQPKAAPKAEAPVAVVKPKHKSPGGGTSPRPPVVTIMGHVDHGKTTLLDAIRKTNVVEGEFGGITQHIGAYQVEVDHEGEKRKITFLDTPGHAAFMQMRARGAEVTDIAILVVAADDGIMPQTVEAINHAKAAQVPIIVAVNKVDKPDSNPDRVLTQLTEHEIVPTAFGGETECVMVSAKAGTGLDDLLEHILYAADLLELRADPHAKPQGVIIEAKQEVGRGPVATVLVQQGTLRVGDAVVCGSAHGRVRAMTNERGERLQKAGPATPVEFTGLSAPPEAGDRLEEAKDEKSARQMAEREQQAVRDDRLSKSTGRLTLEDMVTRIRQGELKEMRVIVKGDVKGSVEAVVGQINHIQHEEIRVRVIHSGVGNISENDVMHASSTDALVIGFNVRADGPAQALAEREKIDVRTFNIIYELVDAVERTMKGMLAPIYEEVPLGKAEVRATFRTPKAVIIAGCYVTDGKIVRNALCRVRREADVVVESKIDSLKHIKEDVREMAQGFECGIVIADFSDVKIGDVIECYRMEQVERK
jgi:translation initiation factor IF-2